MRSMYQGVGQDDLHPFVEVILTQEAIKGDASPIISELISFAVSQGECPVSGNSELRKHTKIKKDKALGFAVSQGECPVSANSE